MMSAMKRWAWVATVFLAVGTASTEPARAWCLWGFGQCETANPVAGEYVRDGDASATLSIASDRITAKTGPVSFTVNYAVKSVEGKNVTIEVSLAELKETVQIQVEKDMIKIRHRRFFFGDWKKKGANS
jgi:hypothetical protein